MADNDGASSLPAVPAPAPSSLQGDAVLAKSQIETWLSQGASSPYYRGLDGGWSASRIQQHYGDLLRAELAGAVDAIGPAQSLDADMPLSAAHYNIEGASGAASMDAADRDVVDSFLPVAFAAGLGQRKIVQAVGWALTVDPTERQFEDLAIAAGWSDAAIKTCLTWARAEVARRGGRK